MISNAARDFWSTPGRMTTFDENATSGIPADPVALRAIVPTLLVHPGWAAAYDVEVDEAREAETNLRDCGSMTAALLGRLDAPLTSHRRPRDRITGTCRNFTVFHVGLLRSVGIPARARCGHASYFEAGRWIDHWVTEWWNASEARWVRADPQLDDIQRSMLQLDWSADDLPPGAFLTGGECWVAIRDGRIDPEVCGIFDMWGSWFVRSNTVRDLAALNKCELLPWDVWGIMEQLDQIGSDTDNALIDDVARVCSEGDLDAIRSTFGDSGFAVPGVITSFVRNKPVSVTLGGGEQPF